MAISPDRHWNCPDYPEDLFAEADAHSPCPPYDYEAERDFPRKRSDVVFFWIGVATVYGLLGYVTWWLTTGRTI